MRVQVRSLHPKREREKNFNVDRVCECILYFLLIKKTKFKIGGKEFDDYVLIFYLEEGPLAVAVLAQQEAGRQLV